MIWTVVSSSAEGGVACCSDSLMTLPVTRCSSLTFWPPLPMIRPTWVLGTRISMVSLTSSVPATYPSSRIFSKIKYWAWKIAIFNDAKQDRAWNWIFCLKDQQTVRNQCKVMKKRKKNIEGLNGTDPHIWFDEISTGPFFFDIPADSSWCIEGNIHPKFSRVAKAHFFLKTKYHAGIWTRDLCDGRPTL